MRTYLASWEGRYLLCQALTRGVQMPALVCKACGDWVWAEPGREIRSAAAHAREAGHANAGLALASSEHARGSRWNTLRPRSERADSSLRRRWEGLPLSTRVVIALTLWLLAFVAAVAISDAGSHDDGIPCGTHLERRC